MFNTQWAKKFYANLICHNLSPGQINHLQRMARAASNYPWGGSNPQNAPDTANRKLGEDVVALEEHIDKIKPYVRREHALSGVQFLMERAFTPKGKLRQTANGRQFLLSDLDTLLACTGIRFDGLFEYNTNPGGRYHSAFMSNFIVESPHAYFAYRMRPWQAAGGAFFQIYSRGEELP